MNEIKLEIENKLDGSKTYRGKNPKFVNSPKQLNFPNSPRNKNINLLNLGNINTNQFSKYISKKGNSSSNNNILLENKSKAYKQQSSNNIINNQINKKIKDQNKERIFQKGALNEKLESLLFKNKIKAKKNNNNMNLLNPKPKIFNNIKDTTTRIKLNNNEFKINLNSFMEYKQQKNSSKPKYNSKRSSSVINANKVNEKIKENNNLTYKDNLFTKNNNENEKINPVKTPIKKIIIESDKKNKNINDINNNINSNNMIKLNNKKKIDVEENHFRAVLYNQEIKKLKNKLN